MSEKNKENYKCLTCGKTFASQERNFRSSKSEIYAANNYRLSICNNCLDELYNKYLDEFDNDYEIAMKLICQQFDIYFDQKIAKRCRTVPKDKSRTGYYIKQMNLGQYKNKTYVDYVKEQRFIIGNINQDKPLDDEDVEIIESAKRIFGVVKNIEDAKMLMYFYNDWMVKTGAESIAQRQAIVNICWNLLDITKARENGSSTKEYEEALLKNITFGGWKPSSKDENLSGETFGTWIKKIEMDKPIEEYPDKSYIKELIEVYYYGHTAVSLGVNNIYSEKYKEHMDKYTVEMNEEEDKAKDELASKAFGE